MSRRLEALRLTPKFDRRRKLTEEQKEEIRKRKDKSSRQLAKEYGVSRRLIVFIQHPERLERQKELYRERRKDGRYYNREDHTESIRQYRNYKRELLKKKKLSFPPRMNRCIICGREFVVGKRISLCSDECIRVSRRLAVRRYKEKKKQEGLCQRKS